MPEIDVDGIIFDFPNGWTCSKYDQWKYYKAYSKARSGTKAVDLVAVNSQNTAWFVEVKDYRAHRRTKTIDLSDEVAQKVHDTLASLFAAKTNGNDEEERRVARSMARALKLRVVLHLEQPVKHSKLFPRAINPTDIRLKLRTLLKPVDAHPLVVESARMQDLAWTVS